MKNLTQIVGTPTMVWVMAASMFFIFTLFKVSLVEILTFFVISSTFAIIWSKLEQWLFPKIFPEMKWIFPVLRVEEIMQADDATKNKIFTSMQAFPSKRTYYILALNILKVIPETSYCLFGWDHGLKMTTAIFYGSSIVMLNLSYCIGMVYYENHAFLTGKIKDLKEKLGFSRVFFSRETFQLRSSQMNQIAVVTLLAIFFFACLMQITIAIDQTITTEQRLLQTLGVWFFSSVHILRFLTYSREQVFQGLEETFEYFATEHSFKDAVIPLNTLPLVGYYQHFLNTLLARVKTNERNFSNWILDLAEKRRYDELGQITGLVVHDLINPLHTLMHCSQVIRSKEITEIHPYVEQIDNGLNHAIEILTHLKGRIRGSKDEMRHGSLVKAYNIATRAVGIHFRSQNVAAIHFEYQPTSYDLVQIPQLELNQILTTLYTNAVDHLLKQKIVNPKIGLYVQIIDNEQLAIQIVDNGSGLAPENFDFSLPKGQRNPGIGLKLTYRLIEMYGGLLTLEKTPEERGTTLSLRLQKYIPTTQEDALDEWASPLGKKEPL